EPPQTQAGKWQRNRSPFKTFQNSTGSESIPVESRKGDQQNWDSLGGDSHLQPWVKETESSTLPQTQSTEQTNFLQDPGKQLDDLPTPASLSHLEFHLSCPMMTASEKEISLDPDGTAVDPPDCGEEIKENVRMGVPSPATLFGAEMATPSEKTSRRAKATSLKT
ncbi:GTPase Era, partial [Varanus komodoensis]